MTEVYNFVTNDTSSQQVELEVVEPIVEPAECTGAQCHEEDVSTDLTWLVIKSLAFSLIFIVFCMPDVLKS